MEKCFTDGVKMDAVKRVSIKVTEEFLVRLACRLAITGSLISSSQHSMRSAFCLEVDHVYPAGISIHRANERWDRLVEQHKRTSTPRRQARKALEKIDALHR